MKTKMQVTTRFDPKAPIQKRYISRIDSLPPKGERGKYLGKVDLKRTPTYHEGANDERTAILAHIRRSPKLKDSTGTWVELCILEKWILTRDERYKKRNGGL